MKQFRLFSLLTVTVMLVGILAACAGAPAPAAPVATEAPAAPVATEAPKPVEAATAPAGDEDPCAYGGEIKAIEAVDDLTVKFSLCYPDPAFPAKAADTALAVLAL